VRVLAAAALVMLLAACSSAPSEVDPSQPAEPAPIASRPPAAAAVAQTAPSRDQCGAAEMQGFVGKSRTEVPVAIDPSRRRVACTTCPVTMDFQPQRLNFFFDAATGIIKEVRCG
jgi:hypothetical protein